MTFVRTGTQSSTEKRRFVWWGTAVLLIAATFRLILLHDVPPGLAQDEVLNADIVQFIRGGTHALFFREGFGHEPLYHYFSVPFQLLLGDNVLSIRLPAVTLGLLLVALTLRWAKRAFGVGTAVLTGIGLAISWWPIVFSRVGIRPILEPVLLLVFAWFWPKRPWLAGLFLGLSVYSYTGARVVFAIPVLLAVYFFLAQKHTEWRNEQIKAALLTLGVSLLVALPLFLTLRADPTLQQRVDQLLGPLEALQNGDFQPIWQTTVQTLGVFSFTGDPRWTYSLPGRPLFDWGTAVFFYAGLCIVLWRWRQPRYAFVLIWLGVGLIPSAVTPQAPSTVRLVGALPVVYLLPALAGTAVYQRLRQQKLASWQTIVRPALAALLLGMLIFNSYRTVQDSFVTWAQAETTRLNHYQTVLLDVARHWHMAAHPAEQLVVAEAFFEPIDRDSLIRNLGYDPQARWVQTGEGATGAVVWPGGGDGRFYIPEFAAPAPDLLAVAGIGTTPQFRSENVPSFAIYPLPDTPPTLQTVEPTHFDEQITLMGYEILPPIVGEPLVAYTLWRVEQALPSNLAAFMHLVDDTDQIVAQHDGFDAAPITLRSGDLVLQRHVLPVESAGAATQFDLYLGLYLRGSGERLRFGTTSEERFWLTTVFVDER
ncbi:ArnT family glycosyltransferase [Candidatus Leptofilum sp.]|uniref:ArnT family glycosyltransferase n=1 Tax=Candidatus Leptofilum sp. TaxID=3241576 RepID=UPI003B5951F7